MFPKYISNNFKKSKIKYIVIALCEVILLLISLFACGVLMNYVSEEEGAQYEAKRFTFSFLNLDGINLDNPENAELIKQELSKLPRAVDIREGLVEFCGKSPVEIDVLTEHISGMEKGYNNRVQLFPTYDDLVYYYTEKFKKYWSLPKNVLPSKEQYLNREKVAIAGKASGYGSKGDYVYTDSNHILFGSDNDEYLVLGENPALIYFDIFLGSEPDGAKVSSINFTLKEFPTDEQRSEIEALFKEIVTPEIVITNSWAPEENGLLEARKSSSIIALTALMLLVSAFNIMAIFKSVIDERKGDYAVFRLCGYGKTKAMLFPFFEVISISAVCTVLSCVIFQLLKPLITPNYPVISVLFDLSFYAVFTLGFIGITAVLFLVYIAPSLNKSISGELREI